MKYTDRPHELRIYVGLAQARPNNITNVFMHVLHKVLPLPVQQNYPQRHTVPHYYHVGITLLV